MDEQRYIEEQYDEIDIMELVRKLLKSWKLIAVYCAVAAVIGLVVGFSIPKEYTVNAKLAQRLRRNQEADSFLLSPLWQVSIWGR